MREDDWVFFNQIRSLGKLISSCSRVVKVGWEG